MAKTLEANGIELVSGGTDNHLILVKTDSVNMSGKDAEAILESAAMTCNKNMVPGDTRSPFVTSGIRLGTPAITTRGFGENEAKMVGEWIAAVLKDSSKSEKIKNDVMQLCEKFPLYPNMN
jgi:glycine hydroxymethyltransferase